MNWLRRRWILTPRAWWLWLILSQVVLPHGPLWRRWLGSGLVVFATLAYEYRCRDVLKVER